MWIVCHHSHMSPITYVTIHMPSCESYVTIHICYHSHTTMWMSIHMCHHSHTTMWIICHHSHVTIHMSPFTYYHVNHMSPFTYYHVKLHEFFCSGHFQFERCVFSTLFRTKTLLQQKITLTDIASLMQVSFVHWIFQWCLFFLLLLPLVILFRTFSLLIHCQWWIHFKVLHYYYA